MSEYKCAYCNYNTRKRKSSYQLRRVLNGPEYEWERHYLCSLSKPVTEKSVLCNACRTKLYKIKKSFFSQSSTESEDYSVLDKENVDPNEAPNVPHIATSDCHTPVVSINANVTPTTNASCVICHAPVVTGRCVTISTEARLDLLIRYRVLTQATNRICCIHLEGKRLKPDVSYTIDLENQVTDMSCAEASKLIEEFIKYSSDNQTAFCLDFLSPKFRDSDCLTWTGWTRDQFAHMVDYLKEVRESSNRNKYSALLVFWVKLKTNMSFLQIGSLIIENSDNGRRSAARVFRSVANGLDRHFVPMFLGASHLSREAALADHMTAYCSVLYNDNLCLIWDGTYYYTQKSGNYRFSRKIYSGHKHRSLVKFMSIILPDGYVLETLGPYFADGKNNDAGITQHILTLHGELTDWLEEGDVCILDRGFRDVLDVFEDLGLEPKMPAFLKAGLAQHSVQEANESRLVTKIRWAVEAYHGRMKKWQFFDQVIHHDLLDIIGPVNRVTSAALNAFRPPLITTTQHDTELAAEMLQKAEHSRNELQAKVERGPLSSRGRWTPMDAQDAVPDFPSLCIQQLQDMTYGTYQLKQAKSYTREHMSEDGEYSIDVHLHAPGLMRSRIQSRHINAKKYFCWIEYDPEQILAWFCQCKAGQRTVGCCAHIASILWYLGFVRHNQPDTIMGKKQEPSIMNAADR